MSDQTETKSAKARASILERFVRLDAGHGYKTSRDYSLLFDIATNQSVVCFVDSPSKRCKDIAATMCGHGVMQVTTRGIVYVFAENKEEFIKECADANLEFIEPVL